MLIELYRSLHNYSLPPISRTDRSTATSAAASPAAIPLRSFRNRAHLHQAPLVDGADLCRGLKERHFVECSAHLRSYDPAFLYAATADRCVMESSGAHYPHRTASMLSGISRCLGAIQVRLRL